METAKDDEEMRGVTVNRFTKGKIIPFLNFFQRQLNVFFPLAGQP